MVNLENSTLSSEKANVNAKVNNVTAKLLRESTTIGGALVDGSVKGLENLPKDIPQIATGFGIGTAMGVISKAGTLGEVGVAVAGTAMLGSWLYSSYKNDFGKLSNAISSTWVSDKNHTQNKQAIQDTLGTFLGQGILYGVAGGSGFKFGTDFAAPQLASIGDNLGIKDVFSGIKASSKADLATLDLNLGDSLGFKNIADTSLNANANEAGLLKTAKEIANPPKAYEGLEGLTKLQRDRLLSSDVIATELKGKLNNALISLKENDKSTAKLSAEIKDLKTNLGKTEKLQHEHDAVKASQARMAMYELDKVKLVSLENEHLQIDKSLETDRAIKDGKLGNNVDIKPLSIEEIDKMKLRRTELNDEIRQLRSDTSNVVNQAIQKDVAHNEAQLAKAQSEAPQKIADLNVKLTEKQSTLNLQQTERPVLVENINSLVTDIHSRYQQLLEADTKAQLERALKPVDKQVKASEKPVAVKEKVTVPVAANDNIHPVTSNNVKPVLNEVSIPAVSDLAKTVIVNDNIKPVISDKVEVQLNEKPVLDPVSKALIKAQSQVKALSDQRTLKYVEHTAKERLAEIKSANFVDEVSKNKAIAQAETKLANASEMIAKSGKPKYLDALNSLVDYAKILSNDSHKINDESIANLQKMIVKVSAKSLDISKLNSFDSNEVKLNFMIKAMDKTLNTDILKNPSMLDLVNGVENGNVANSGSAYVFDRQGKMITWTDNEGQVHPKVIDLARLSNSGLGRDGAWLGRFRDDIHNIGGIVIRTANYDENGEPVKIINKVTGKSFVPTAIVQSIGQVPTWIQDGLDSQKQIPYNVFLKQLDSNK